MKMKTIFVAMCLAFLSSPAYSTGLLEAKLAAAAGIAKSVALLGAGAIATKGAILKEVGSLMAAKGTALQNAFDNDGKPTIPSVVPNPKPPSTIITQPSVINCPPGSSVIVEQPTFVTSKPPVAPKPPGPLISAEVLTPILSTGLNVESKPLATLLDDRVPGLLSTIDQTLGNLLGRTVVVNPQPIVYKMVRPPTYYTVPTAPLMRTLC